MTNKTQLNLTDDHDELINIDMVYTTRIDGLHDGAKNLTECKNRLLAEYKYFEDLEKLGREYEIHFAADRGLVHIRIPVSNEAQIEDLENFGFIQEDPSGSLSEYLTRIEAQFEDTKAGFLHNVSDYKRK